MNLGISDEVQQAFADIGGDWERFLDQERRSR